MARAMATPAASSQTDFKTKIRAACQVNRKELLAKNKTKNKKEKQAEPLQQCKIFTEEGLNLVITYLTTVGRSNNRDVGTAQKLYETGNEDGAIVRRNIPIPEGDATCRQIYQRKYLDQPEEMYWGPPEGGDLGKYGYIEFDHDGITRRCVVWFKDAETKKDPKLCISIENLYLALVYGLQEKSPGNLLKLERWFIQHFTAPAKVIKEYFIPLISETLVLQHQQRIYPERPLGKSEHSEFASSKKVG